MSSSTSMSKRSFCNCHWSRQVSCMRHCWNKIFFIIIRVMVVINQLVIMSPFICLKNSKKNSISIAPNTAADVQQTQSDYNLKWRFRTQRVMTAVAVILAVLYAVASPFMVKMAAEVYTSTRPGRDNVFIAVAKFTMSTDVLCFLFVMASNIWQRENVVKVLNLFQDIIKRFECLEKNFIGFKTCLVLILKSSLIAYDTVLSLPHLMAAASRFSTQSLLAFLFTHYLRSLGSLFDLSIFVCILLSLSCSLQLEQELQCSCTPGNAANMHQLMSLQDSLQHLMALFRTTFQFGIFLIILSYFVTILCNIYAMLDFYVVTHIFYSSFVTYLISLATELYSLIYVTYLWDRSQQKVKDLFLQNEEFGCLKPTNSLSVVEADVLWPLLNEFQLLGLFTLNNGFALFLLSYSINFVVIILEFEVNKAHQ